MCSSDLWQPRMAARGNAQKDTTPTDLFSIDAATCVIAGAMEAGKWLSTVSPSKCPATLLNSLEQFPAFSTAEIIHQKKVNSKICKRIRHSWRTDRFLGLSPCEHTTASQLFQTTPASPSLRAPSLVPGSENGLGPRKNCLLLFPVWGHRPPRQKSG